MKTYTPDEKTTDSDNWVTPPGGPLKQIVPPPPQIPKPFASLLMTGFQTRFYDTAEEQFADMERCRLRGICVQTFERGPGMKRDMYHRTFLHSGVMDPGSTPRTS